MSHVRQIGSWGCSLAAVAWLMFTTLACKPAQGDDSLESRIQAADQIVLVTPENDVDVEGGQRFSVRVDRVLRGKVKPQEIIKILQAGQGAAHPKFAGKQQYLFLLKNPADLNTGWLYLGQEAFPVKNGQVEIKLPGDEKAEQVSIPDLVKVIVENPPSSEQIAPRKGVVGNWFVVLSEGGHDQWMWLISISGEVKQSGGTSYSAKMLGATSLLPSSLLESANITDSTVELLFRSQDAKLRFQGKWGKGGAQGAIENAGVGMTVGRLVPTDRTSLEGYNEPRNSLGQEDYLEALGQEKSAAIQKFIQEYPQSPLIIDAYAALAGLLVNEKGSRETIQAAQQEYLKTVGAWGPALEVRANFEIGAMLLHANYLPDLGLKFFEAAEKGFTDFTPAYFKSVIHKERARSYLAQKETAKGVELLQQLHKSNPFDPEVTYLLALQKESDKKTSEAISLYAEIAALPMQESMLAQILRQRGEKNLAEILPGALLKKLWATAPAQPGSLAEYLNHVYENAIRKVASEPFAPRKAGAGTRVMLLELFTGTSCPPCVAADVAVSALEATFKPTELIALRYHVHSPAPDPLANPDSEKRLQVYKSNSTPTLILNGRQLPVGGGLAEAAQFYKLLRGSIEPLLQEKIDLSLQLSATAMNGKADLRATAGGLKSFPPEVRLLLAVAEERVNFIADNGIRVHEMVVRAMPAGESGVAPDKTGQLTFQRELDIPGLREATTHYLAGVEREVRRPFRDKPVEMKQLRFVAFLQSTETGKILQAASIPITGSLEPEPKKPADKPAPPAKPATEAKPATPAAEKPAEGVPPAPEKSAPPAKK